ncbi:MAG: hypothetical protein WAM85_22530 [Terracidiphilus sp.]
MTWNRFSKLIPHICTIKAVFSLGLVTCLSSLSGCSGGSTQPTPTPTPIVPPSGSEYLVSFGGQGWDGTSLGNLLSFPLNSTSGVLGSSQNSQGPQSSDSPMYAGTNLWATPGSKFVYFAGAFFEGNSPGPYGIFSYSVASDGTLPLLSQGEPFVPQIPFEGATGVVMDGAGKFLYISDEDSATGKHYLRAFLINPNTGAISEGPILTNTTVSYQYVQAADPTGSYVYEWEQDSSYNLFLRAFLINGSTGALTEVAGSPYLVAASSTTAATWPTGLGSLAISPSGKFLYAGVTYAQTTVQLSPSQVYAYSIGPSGALSQVGSSPVSIQAQEIASLLVHPNGNYLYVSYRPGDPTGDNSAIATYSLNPASGAVSNHPTSTIQVADDACCSNLLFDSSAKVLLGSGESWNSFTVDGSTGALTFAGSTPTMEYFSGVVVKTP